MGIKPRPLDGGYRGSGSASEQRRRHNMAIPQPTDTAAGSTPGERKNRSATNQRRQSRPGGRGNR